MSDVIMTKSLAVGYDKAVIKDINIEVKAGEIASLIGPNGVGKTTFIKTVSGIIKPISGKVFLDGNDLENINLNDRAKYIASVLTEKSFADIISCREMVSMGRYPFTGRLGKLSKSDEDIVLKCMELTDTVSISEKDFTKISDGQRQRVLLARAICQEPKLLLLDEPTSFLDVKYKIEFLQLLRKLSSDMGFAVIVSLHELDMAKQISDKIICFKDDKVDRIGTPSEIFSGGYIKSLFDITSGDFDETTGLSKLWQEK
ncbi:MAG: ABC transporter ATP-binding protein [Lachnospiraceae bacterium]|nr:ABC transporter ATP-binding protein [Lachnospiraceae bacterium]